MTIQRPHNPWQEISPGSRVWLHSYHYKKFGPANAVAFGIDPQAIAIISPPPNPNETLISNLEAHGPVTSLIISNIGHTGGFRDWLVYKPTLYVYAPDDILDLLARLNIQNVAPLSSLAPDATIQIVNAPGTKVGVTLLKTYCGSRPVVFGDELLINMATAPTAWLPKLFFALFRNKTGLQVNRLFQEMMCKDVSILAKTLLSLIEDDPIFIPAHGAPLIEKKDLARARLLLETLAI